MAAMPVRIASAGIPSADAVATAPRILARLYRPIRLEETSMLPCGVAISAVMPSSVTELARACTSPWEKPKVTALQGVAFGKLRPQGIIDIDDGGFILLA